jgi:hypothetical protein
LGNNSSSRAVLRLEFCFICKKKECMLSLVTARQVALPAVQPSYRCNPPTPLPHPCDMLIKLVLVLFSRYRPEQALGDPEG